MRKHLLAALCLALCGLTPPGVAQEYPNRPVRLIVPQPPGGPSDIVARLVAQRLSERLGQPFVVENRPGAGSNIGTEMLAKAPRDGYTIGLATVQHIVNPFLFASLPFDPVRDFAPITLISKAHIVLVVHPETPANNLRELIALARARPGGLNWASAGNGGTSHLAIELFKTATGVEVTHVPYKGTQPALTDLLGARVPVMFDGLVTSLPHLRAGKLRALAVASLARSPLLPDTPTMTEAGLAGFEAVGLAAFMAPAGAPVEAIHRLQRETAAVVNAPDLRERLVAMGLEVVANTPAEFGEYLRADSAKWGKLIRAAKIRAE
jgi:tripartite-type tricarboxylate transporter receptor subunit TctC